MKFTHCSFLSKICAFWGHDSKHFVGRLLYWTTDLDSWTTSILELEEGSSLFYSDIWNNHRGVYGTLGHFSSVTFTARVAYNFSTKKAGQWHKDLNLNNKILVKIVWYSGFLTLCLLLWISLNCSQSNQIDCSRFHLSRLL